MRHKFHDTLTEHVRASGKPKSQILHSLIEKHLSCEKLAEKMKSQGIDSKSVKRKDWMSWKQVCHHIYDLFYEKIKLIAKASQTSVSEVIDDALENHLPSFDSQKTYEETIEKIFEKPKK